MSGEEDRVVRAAGQADAGGRRVRQGRHPHDHEGKQHDSALTKPFHMEELQELIEVLLADDWHEQVTWTRNP
jgi:hypothetical protein